MSYHQSNVFSKICQILFIIGSTCLFFFIPEFLNNSRWCFSSSSSSFEDRRRFCLHILSVLFKIRDSSLLPSSRNCFDRENSFHLSGVIQESSQFAIRSPSIQIYSFSAVSYHSPILPVLSSSDLQSARDLFVLLYLNSLKLLHSFANSYPVFLYLLIILFNSYGGCSSVLFLLHHINSFLVSILPVVRSRHLLKIMLYLSLILSTRISSIPNLLIVINLTGEGYA